MMESHDRPVYEDILSKKYGAYRVNEGHRVHEVHEGRGAYGVHRVNEGHRVNEVHKARESYKGCGCNKGFARNEKLRRSHDVYELEDSEFIELNKGCNKGFARNEKGCKKGHDPEELKYIEEIDKCFDDDNYIGICCHSYKFLDLIDLFIQNELNSNTCSRNDIMFRMYLINTLIKIIKDSTKTSLKEVKFNKRLIEMYTDIVKRSNNYISQLEESIQSCYSRKFENGSDSESEDEDEYEGANEEFETPEKNKKQEEEIEEQSEYSKIIDNIKHKQNDNDEDKLEQLVEDLEELEDLEGLEEHDEVFDKFVLKEPEVENIVEEPDKDFEEPEEPSEDNNNYDFNIDEEESIEIINKEGFISDSINKLHSKMKNFKTRLIQSFSSEPSEEDSEESSEEPSKKTKKQEKTKRISKRGEIYKDKLRKIYDF